MIMYKNWLNPFALKTGENCIHFIETSKNLIFSTTDFSTKKKSTTDSAYMILSLSL